VKILRGTSPTQLWRTGLVEDSEVGGRCDATWQYKDGDGYGLFDGGYVDKATKNRTCMVYSIDGSGGFA